MEILKCFLNLATPYVNNICHMDVNMRINECQMELTSSHNAYLFVVSGTFDT